MRGSLTTRDVAVRRDWWGYAGVRRADPRIAAAIEEALGDASDVVNVGAGTGSYEPADRRVIGIEPSRVMIGQRQAGAAPCIAAVAEAIPLASRSCDATMAILTIHHWNDLRRGLREMRRVARRRAVFLTWVPDSADFWLTRDYFPEIQAIDTRAFPSTDRLTAHLKVTIGPPEIESVPIPADCVDGFLCAYWRRPDAYLDAAVRAGISRFPLISPEAGLARLRRDLEDGSWHRRNGYLMGLDTLDVGYRIVRCEIAADDDHDPELAAQR